MRLLTKPSTEVVSTGSTREKAAPIIDLNYADGSHILIEERTEGEVHYITGLHSECRSALQRATSRDLGKKHGRALERPPTNLTRVRVITALLAVRGIIKPNRRAIAALFR